MNMFFFFKEYIWYKNFLILDVILIIIKNCNFMAECVCGSRWLVVCVWERERERDRQRQTECENSLEIKESYPTMTDQSMAGRWHIWSENDINLFLFKSEPENGHARHLAVLNHCHSSPVHHALYTKSCDTCSTALSPSSTHNPVSASSVLNPLPHLSR